MSTQTLDRRGVWIAVAAYVAWFRDYYGTPLAQGGATA